MVESEAEFLMEVTDKTKADVKVRDLHLSDAKVDMDQVRTIPCYLVLLQLIDLLLPRIDPTEGRGPLRQGKGRS